MRKKLLIALGVIVGLFVVFAGVVAVQPSDFRVARSTEISAPPEAVFAHVNDFHQWDHWSPWAKLDPNSKATFEGPSEGTGAIFKWSGNDQVGEGRMTILESRPTEFIRIQLDFIRPFEDTANVEFSFKPEGKRTHVTWVMSGQQNFFGKAICLFMNMDKMVGADFEKGLAQMKSFVEKDATPE